MFRTPKRTKPMTLDNEKLHITPPSRILKLRPAEFDKSPANGSPNALSPTETRRGRPRAEVLNSLILQGSTSPSSIKCTFCNRVFPREKSLQAHLRTHTGEKPYICDYPRCTRRFAQSGQLKTHQRLHTGEKPFVCSARNCERRFTHANRHCPEHPDLQLKRFALSVTTIVEKINDEEHSNAVQKWLDSVNRKEKRSTSNSINTTPKKTHRNLNNGWRFREEQNENINYLNIQPTKIFKMENLNGSSPSDFAEESVYNFVEEETAYNYSEEAACTYVEEPACVPESDSGASSQEFADMAAHALMQLREGRIYKNQLMSQEELSFSDGDVYQSDSQTEFLSESFTDEHIDLMTDSQTDSSPDSLPEMRLVRFPSETSEIPKKRWLQQWDSTQDLAQPINWSEDTPNIVETENQKRPTVLVRVENGQEKEVSKSDMQVAMALVELGNAQPTTHYNY